MLRATYTDGGDRQGGVGMLKPIRQPSFAPLDAAPGCLCRVHHAFDLRGSNEYTPEPVGANGFRLIRSDGPTIPCGSCLPSVPQLHSAMGCDTPVGRQ